MLKNWKDLFIKKEEEELAKQATTATPYSFPIGNTTAAQQQPQAIPSASTITDPAVSEVLKVYENGLDSINMPGYDFYEFYQAIMSTGSATEQAYNMAFHMAKTLDKTITAHKLVQDAEFYISKVNEVHSQYVTQGQQKLHALQEKKAAEKNKLNAEIDEASKRVIELRNELQQLETNIHNKRSTLGKIEDGYQPQEKTIREKLNANDQARLISIDKLSSIKEGILRHIKG